VNAIFLRIKGDYSSIHGVQSCFDLGNDALYLHVAFSGQFHNTIALQIARFLLALQLNSKDVPSIYDKEKECHGAAA